MGKLNKMKESTQQVLGIILAILSGFLHTSVGFLLQLRRLNYSDVIFAQGLSNAPFLLILICVKNLPLMPTVEVDTKNGTKDKLVWSKSALFGFLLIQGFIGGWTALGSYISFTFLPLGDAMSFIYAAPIFVAIMSRIFLGTPLKLYKIFFGILILVGTGLVLNPSFVNGPTTLATNDTNLTSNETSITSHAKRTDYFIGLAFAFSVAILSGVYCVLNAGPLKCQNKVLPLFYMSLWCLVQGLVSSTFNSNESYINWRILSITALDVFELLATGILVLAGYAAMNASLQMIDPTVVSLCRSLEIVIGYTFQVGFLGEQTSAQSLVGASLVLGAVIAITLEKYALNKIENKTLRNLL